MFYESRLLYIKVIKIIKKKCLYGTILHDLDAFLPMLSILLSSFFEIGKEKFRKVK